MERIKEIYEEIAYWIHCQLEILGRMVYYGWNARNCHDYHPDSLYQIIHLKLNRSIKYLRSGGTLFSTRKPLSKKLIIASQLAKRLSEDAYLDNAVKPFKTKFGKAGFENSVFAYYSCDNNILQKAEMTAFNYLILCMKRADRQRKFEHEYLLKLITPIITDWRGL